MILPTRLQFFDNTGNPLVGGKVFVYDPGTSTPKNTYSDYNFVTPNPHPVILDSAGVATIYIDGSYKIILKDSADVTLQTLDNCPGDSQYLRIPELSKDVSLPIAASRVSQLITFDPAGDSVLLDQADVEVDWSSIQNIPEEILSAITSPNLVSTNLLLSLIRNMSKKLKELEVMASFNAFPSSSSGSGGSSGNGSFWVTASGTIPGIANRYCRFTLIGGGGGGAGGAMSSFPPASTSGGTGGNTIIGTRYAAGGNGGTSGSSGAGGALPVSVVLPGSWQANTLGSGGTPTAGKGGSGGCTSIPGINGGDGAPTSPPVGMYSQGGSGSFGTPFLGTAGPGFGSGGGGGGSLIRLAGGGSSGAIVIFLLTYLTDQACTIGTGGAGGLAEDGGIFTHDGGNGSPGAILVEFLD